MSIEALNETLVAFLKTAPHRLSGTPEAETARNWIIERLKGAGLTVEVEPFEYTIAANLAVIGTMVNAWGTIVLSLIATVINPWVGLALLAILNALDFFVMPQLSRPIKRQGVNVFAGVSRPWANITRSKKPLVLISSHYDSAEAEPGWLRQLMSNSDTYFSVAAVGLVLLAVYFLATGIMVWVPGADGIVSQIETTWASWLRWIVILLGLPIVLTSTVWAFRGLVSKGLVNPGADDNASGVSVALGLIDPLSRISAGTEIETVVAFFDGEEIGFQGSRYFVRKYADSLKPSETTIINLDCVGRGDSLAVVAGQGMIQKLRTNPDILGQWRRSSQRDGIRTIELWLTFLTGGSDQAAWLKRGFSRALTVSHGVAVPKRARTVLYRLLGIRVEPVDLDMSHLHSEDDSLEAITPQALESTRTAVVRFVELLTREKR